MISTQPQGIGKRPSKLQAALASKPTSEENPEALDRGAALFLPW